MSSNLKNVWIEQDVQKNNYRPAGKIEFGLTKSLCLPKELVSKNPRISSVSKDDVIFHLKGGNIFSSVSLVASSEMEEVVIDGSVFVYINLKNTINISHPILIKDEVLTYEHSDLLVPGDRLDFNFVRIEN